MQYSLLPSHSGLQLSRSVLYTPYSTDCHATSIFIAYIPTAHWLSQGLFTEVCTYTRTSSSPWPRLILSEYRGTALALEVGISGRVASVRLAPQGEGGPRGWDIRKMSINQLECIWISHSGKYSWGPNFILFVLSLSERNLTHETYVMMGVFSCVNGQNKN